MELEILEIIKNNLPEQVGIALRGRLEQADKDAQAVKTLTSQVLTQSKDIEELNLKLEEYKKCDIRNADLSTREAKVQEDTRSLKISNLETLLAAEQDKTLFVKEVALGLVRNAEYRKTAFNGTTVAIPDHNGYLKTTTTNVDLQTHETIH